MEVGATGNQERTSSARKSRHACGSEARIRMQQMLNSKDRQMCTLWAEAHITVRTFKNTALSPVNKYRNTKSIVDDYS